MPQRRSDDRWILERRPPKQPVDPRRPYAFSVEEERTAAGQVDSVATIFLTNRECPFRCLMCDLWMHTTDDRVPDGAIPAQIRWALTQLSPARHVKLYNSGNFFDAQAIPPTDFPQIALAVTEFDTVVVENHPRLVGERCLAFRDLLEPQLEVAMGLETVHTAVLERLNKRMTLEDFARATRYLVANGIAVRAFILLRPPFLDESEGVIWAKRSIDFAFDVGVECCVIIPTRAGNGALDWLQKDGDFGPPRLESLEEVLQYGIGLRHGSVFADLWDCERFAPYELDGPDRVARMRQMNLTQETNRVVRCKEAAS